MVADRRDNQTPPTLVPRAGAWAATLAQRRARTAGRLLRQHIPARFGVPVMRQRWVAFAANVLGKYIPLGRPTTSARSTSPAYAPLPALSLSPIWGGGIEPDSSVAQTLSPAIIQQPAKATSHRDRRLLGRPPFIPTRPEGVGGRQEQEAYLGIPPTFQRQRREATAPSPAQIQSPEAGDGKHHAARTQGAAGNPAARLQAATPLEQAAARLERSSPLVLDQPVIELLARVFHLQASGVKIYANEAADQLARAADADALAYPDRIVFRGGAFDLRSPASLALLGHELTHVARQRAQPAGGRPLAVAERAAEEREALHAERVLLRHLTGMDRPTPDSQVGFAPLALPPLAGSWRDAPLATADRGHLSSDRPAPTPPSAPLSGGNAPRAASHARELGSAPAATPLPASALADAQVHQLKEEIYRDLKARLKIESERGA